MSSQQLFAVCAAWVVAAGLLLSEGTIHHALPAFLAGLAMSAVCPLGLLAASALRRPRRWWR